MFRRISVHLRKIFSKNFKRLASVVIIGIDDGKRSLYGFFRAKNGVCSSPRFCPCGRKAYLLVRKKALVCLEHVFRIKIARYTVEQPFTEILFNIFADNIYDFSKAAFLRIIRGKIKKTLAVFSYAVNLLHSTVTASHSGSKN